MPAHPINPFPLRSLVIPVPVILYVSFPCFAVRVYATTTIIVTSTITIIIIGLLVTHTAIIATAATTTTTIVTSTITIIIGNRTLCLCRRFECEKNWPAGGPGQNECS